MIVKSAKTKVPRDFNSFLMNNDNKLQMIDLIFNYIKEKIYVAPVACTCNLAN